MSERVLVCGDREWDDSSKIAEELRALLRRDFVVLCHGDCRGADRIAGRIAERLGIPVTKFPAEWDKYGGRAGPIRNRQMLNEFRPTMVLAFHDNIAFSKGTKDMVTAARKAGIPTFVFAHRGAAVGRPQENVPK